MPKMPQGRQWTMDRYLSQKNLLIVLAVMLATKYLLLPLIAWQSDEIVALASKQRQVDKLSALTENIGQYQRMYASLGVKLRDAEKYFYADTPNVKLEIQQRVEDLYASNGVAVKGFTWLPETTQQDVSGMRTMTARVSFSGSSDAVIRAFWELSSLPELASYLETRFDLINAISSSLGAMNGHMIVRFYASPVMEGSVLEDDPGKGSDDQGA